MRLERAIEKSAPLLVTPDADAAGTIGNEDIHDLRVALRRLRSWVRASRDLLHPVIRRGDRAALRRLARRAGAARDAQVQYTWLTTPPEPFNAAAARAAAWLAARRRNEYAAEYVALHRRLGARWPALSAAIANSLETATAETSVGDETLAQHLEPVLARHIATARRALDGIEHRSQVRRIHRARIEVKRLRYLLEAIDPHSRTGLRFVRHLRLLQDALGDVHDAHVLHEQLAPWCSTRRRRGDGAPAKRDLLALRAAVRRRELAAFRQGVDAANAAGAASLWRDPASVAATLMRAPAMRQLGSAAATAASSR